MKRWPNRSQDLAARPWSRCSSCSTPKTGERAADIRSRAIVPVEQIAPNDLSASIAFVRANRPGFERKTDAQIMSVAKAQIERAAALAATGASAEEVKAVLLGGAK